MYLGTAWKLKPDEKPRDTYCGQLGKLIVIKERGVVIGSRGIKKVKVNVAENLATVIAEDVKTYTGGYLVREWLNGTESEKLVEMETLVLGG